MTSSHLEVQEFTTFGEEHIEQLQEHRPQNIATLNRQSQSHVYTAGINEHREQRNKKTKK